MEGEGVGAALGTKPGSFNTQLIEARCFDEAGGGAGGARRLIVNITDLLGLATRGFRSRSWWEEIDR